MDGAVVRGQSYLLHSPLDMPTLPTSNGQPHVSEIHLGVTPAAHQCAAVDSLPCRPAPCQPARCRVRLHGVDDREFIMDSEAAARWMWGDRIATVCEVTELRSPGASEDAQNCCSLHRELPPFSSLCSVSVCSRWLPWRVALAAARHTPPPFRCRAAKYSHSLCTVAQPTRSL